MKSGKPSILVLCTLLLIAVAAVARADTMQGIASWYGEAHRGKPMSNGEKFDPDKLTAASWFFPMGTQVRVTLLSQPQRSVVVTITDRGPSRRQAGRGRVIDLARTAFKELADPDAGLTPVTVVPIEADYLP